MEHILDVMLIANKLNRGKTVRISLLSGEYKPIRLFGYNTISINLTCGKSKYDVPEDQLRINAKAGTIEFAYPANFHKSKGCEVIIHFLAGNKYDGRYLVGSCVLI